MYALDKHRTRTTCKIMHSARDIKGQFQDQFRENCMFVFAHTDTKLGDFLGKKSLHSPYILLTLNTCEK